jgi:murein DD-endopeptidase MepM/ murein hydrolase activator NlpD
MSVPNLESPSLNASVALRSAAGRDEAEARRVAAEFESLLLAQLTSALGPSSDDNEDDLFQSSATDLYRQMFGEQMAITMAHSGGIGLADMMLDKVGARQDGGRPAAPGIKHAIEMARLVRREAVEGSTDTPAARVEAEPAEVVAEIKGAGSRRPRRILEPPVTAAGSAGAPGPVSLQMPVEGRVSSRFGSRRDPIRGGHRQHQGVDIAAPRGTPIGAAAAGEVIFAGRQRGYGNTVVIKHADGRQTRYAHAERLLVTAGDRVGAGQTIATVGSTGRSTGPHVHFEVVDGDRHVDPLQAIANGSTLARR